MNPIKYLSIAFLITATSVAKAQNPSLNSNISLAEFVQKAKATNAQIIDARTAEEFAQNHLENAVNISAFSKTYAQDLEKLNPNKPTFIYSIASGRSKSLAKELATKNFKEIYILPGGIANWIGSGYPFVNNTKKGVALSANQFNSLLAADDLVLVDYGSKYCGACKKLIPILDAIESKKGLSAKIIRIEAYDNTELLKQFKISQLPTLVLYRNSKPVWKKQGQSTVDEITQVINQHQKNQTSAQSKL